MKTYRLWLDAGRYHLIRAESRDDAMKKLSRRERRKVTKVTVVVQTDYFALAQKIAREHV